MSGLIGRLRAIPSWQGTLFAALAALGFLVAAQLQSEAPRVRYASEERVPLVATALDLQAQQEALKAAILAERERIGTLERTGEGSAALVSILNAELDRARIAAGLVPLRGPGIVIRLEDAPVTPGVDGERLVSARDVRTVVEELWLAGAEAIEVNRERIVVTTALLDIGGSVLANSAYLTPPYDIAAIGPPTLYERLINSPGFTEFIEARARLLGLRVRFAELDELPVAAYAGTVTVRNGRPVPSATPVPVPSAGTNEPTPTSAP